MTNQNYRHDKNLRENSAIRKLEINMVFALLETEVQITYQEKVSYEKKNLVKSQSWYMYMYLLHNSKIVHGLLNRRCPRIV